MKTLTITLFAMAGTLAGQERPLPSPPQMSGAVRTFNRSCEALRPIAVQIAKKHGWKLDASKQIGDIVSDSGVIRFAAGKRECDVYVHGGDVALLRDIASRLGK